MEITSNNQSSMISITRTNTTASCSQTPRTFQGHADTNVCYFIYHTNYNNN